MIQVGDIIDGRKVTKVFYISGIEAYQSEPVSVDNAKFFPEELPELGERPKIAEPEEIDEKPRRGRKRKED